jgi:hypothetical protein
MSNRLIFNCEEGGEWLALLDDYEAKHDPSFPVGRGPSKLAAVTDLAEQYLAAKAESEQLRTILENMRSLCGTMH